MIKNERVVSLMRRWMAVNAAIDCLNLKDQMIFLDVMRGVNLRDVAKKYGVTRTDVGIRYERAERVIADMLFGGSFDESRGEL